MDQITEISGTDSATTSIQPLALPAAILAYVAKFTPGAVYVVCGSSGFPCVIGSGTDLGTELVAIRKTWPAKIDAPVLAAAWWAVDLRSAQRVVTLALASDLRHFTRDGPRFAVTLREASTAIAATAGRLDVQLTSHDTLLARAGVAVGKIETGLAVAQAGGGLKFFNEEFQKRRREAQTHGKKFMNYGTARTKLFEILAGIAAGADVDRTKVLEQIFGPPGSKAHWWP